VARPESTQTVLALFPDRPREEALGEGCFLLHDPGFARADEQAWFGQLMAELPWVQELYPRGGRFVRAPRLTSFHGDPGCSYVYAGIAYEPRPFTPLLAQIRGRLRAAIGYDWNSVLVNLYRDGADSVGWHADDEPELGPSRDDIAIASLSLGAERRFVLKHRTSGARRAFELGHGALLVMTGRTQQRYVHALPKTQRPVGPRINLTFRVIEADSKRACEGRPLR
jgi:alkylated DNA repair dioxygenase AlkB